MTKKNPAFIINALIVLFEIAAVIISIQQFGNETMVYYTQQSNIVLLVSCALYVYYEKKGEIPEWVKTFRFVSTSLVTVTFLIVCFVLAPSAIPQGTDAVLRKFFGPSNIFMHTSCPILAFVSYLFFEEHKTPNMKQVLIATSPVALYAIVTTSLNIARILHGPYFFLYVYEQPVYMSIMWFFLIPFIGFLIALAIRFLKSKTNK